tara:strand:+ start:360 stop:1505 length:1146 start_codon:yes stop_codon:yes gene_type:complete
MIIVASNSYKEVMCSYKVNEHIINGCLSSNDLKEKDIFNYPMSDGGDGMNLTYSYYQKCQTINIKVRDPIGREAETSILFDEKANIVLIECANVSGLQMVPKNRRELSKSWSFGVGDAIKAAKKLNPQKIIIGMGGSGFADLGVGALTTLGAIIEVDNNRINIKSGLDISSLASITKIDLTPVYEFLDNTEIIFLHDVNNPLLGKTGAANTYGPQKGASNDQIIMIENIAKKIVNLLSNKYDVDFNRAGIGAAGGLCLGFLGRKETSLRLGASFFVEISKILSLDKIPEVLITGEGRFDHTSFFDKLPKFLVEQTRLKYPNTHIIGVFGQNWCPKETKTLFNNTYTLDSDNTVKPIPQLIKVMPNKLNNIGKKIAKIYDTY